MKLSEAITKYGDKDICNFETMFENCDPFEGKKIDMSVCIESGILCEVDSQEPPFKSTALVKLKGVYPHLDTPYEAERGSLWVRGRPAMNGHIHASPTGWDKCPLPEGFVIRVWDMALNDCGMTDYLKLDWTTLTMFQVTGIAEGYEL